MARRITSAAFVVGILLCARDARAEYDLWVKSFTVGMSSGRASFGATICNKGPSTAPEFSTSFYLNRTSSPTCGVYGQIQVLPTGPLASGACVTHSGGGLSYYVAAGTSVTFNSYVFADPGCRLSETTNYNNISTKATKVGSTSSGGSTTSRDAGSSTSSSGFTSDGGSHGSDLRIGAVKASYVEGTASSGLRLSYDVEVCNDGDRPVYSFSLGIYRGSQAPAACPESRTDASLRTIYGGALDAGECTTATIADPEPSTEETAWLFVGNDCRQADVDMSNNIKRNADRPTAGGKNVASEQTSDDDPAEGSESIEKGGCAVAPRTASWASFLGIPLAIVALRRRRVRVGRRRALERNR